MAKKSNPPLSTPSPFLRPQLNPHLTKYKKLELAKRKRIFVDSNFLIALYNPNDTLFTQAIWLAKKIEEQNSTVIFSNFIFLETVTVLSQRVGREAAVQAGVWLATESVFDTLHIDDTLQYKSWQIFQNIKKKNISFIDCSILAVIETEDIPYLLTFDRKDFTSFRKKYHFEFFE